MHANLLSFLSEVETAIMMDQPEPEEGGTWETNRVVNYSTGLARLELKVRPTNQPLQQRGAMAIQSYALADGSNCLKVQTFWHGCDSSRSMMIYAKPGVQWASEARKIAAEWMAGPPRAEHFGEQSPASAYAMAAVG